MYYINASSSSKISKKCNYVIDESYKKWPSEIQKIIPVPESSISSMNRETAMNEHCNFVSDLFKKLKIYTRDLKKQMSELFKEDYNFADEWFKSLTPDDVLMIQYFYENINYMITQWSKNRCGRIKNAGFNGEFQDKCLKLQKSPKINIPIFDDFIKPA